MDVKGETSFHHTTDLKKIPDFYTAVARLDPEAPQNARYRQFLYGFQKDYNEYVDLTQQLETAKANGAKPYEIRQLEGKLHVAESKLKERRGTQMFGEALGQAVEKEAVTSELMITTETSRQANGNVQLEAATAQKGDNNKKKFMEAVLELDPDSKEVGDKKTFWYEVSEAQRAFDQAQEKLRAAKERRTSPGEETVILSEVRQTAERLKELRGRDEFKELLNIAVQKQGVEVADAFSRENADQSRIEAEIVAKYLLLHIARRHAGVTETGFLVFALVLKKDIYSF